MGVRQTHLAKKLGMSPQQLNNIFNREKASRYLPEIAKILGINESELEWGIQESVRLVQIVEDTDLTSLVDESIHVDELMAVVLKSCPSIVEHDYWYFAYQLSKSINIQIIKNDLLIFSTFLPLKEKFNGQVGIAYLQSTKSIFVGTVKFNADQNSLTIINEDGAYFFNKGDEILGVAICFNRKLQGV